MKIPVLKGIYAVKSGEFARSYPVNLEPILLDSGISSGFLRHAPGVLPLSTGPGPDRGSAEWNGTQYRVMGTKLVAVSEAGAVTIIGDVGNGGPVTMDCSFSYLAVNSGPRVYLYDGTTLTQITDPDLGDIIDLIYVDGYFMFTDGTYLIVNDLNDPFSINPLRYGSSEEDPDPIVALRKVRGEIYAVNRTTTEVFLNVGITSSTPVFPFSVVRSAIIPYGAVGTHAITDFNESFAFVGNAGGQAPAVYVAGQGSALKISTREIDLELATLTDAELAAIECEQRTEADEMRLYVHLPAKTWVYFGAASKALQLPVWTVAASGTLADEAYRPRHHLNGIVGDSTGALGRLDYDTTLHWGDVAGWQFDTQLIYNDGARVIAHSAELIGLPGYGAGNPKVFASATVDGRTWGREETISTGKEGDRGKRVQWRLRRRFSTFLGLRFRGADESRMAVATVNAEMEPLG